MAEAPVKEAEDAGGVDAFAQAFAELATKPADTTPAAGEDTAPAAAAGNDTAPPASGAATAPAAASEDKTPAAPPAQPAGGEDTLQSAAVDDKTPAAQAAPATPPAAPAAPPASPAEPAETAAQKAAREAREEMVKPYVPTADEAAALETMKKDYPTEYLAMEARLKASQRSMNAEVFQAISSLMEQVNGVVAPLQQQTQALAGDQHERALTAAHPGWQALAPKIPAWIATQPKVVQAALTETYQNGTTAAVSELLAMYKASTGAATPAPAAPAPKKPAADAHALEPVAAKRATPSPASGVDKNDFMGAWAELEASLSGR